MGWKDGQSTSCCLSKLMSLMHHVNPFKPASPCLDARDSGALWWALQTEHTPSSRPHRAQRTAQASQRTRMRRPLKARRLWSLSTPRSPPSFPTCATSPAIRLRSMLVITPLILHAAAWQRMSAPARCLKVTTLIVLLFFTVTKEDRAVSVIKSHCHQEMMSILKRMAFFVGQQRDWLH